MDDNQSKDSVNTGQGSGQVPNANSANNLPQVRIFLLRLRDVKCGITYSIRQYILKIIDWGEPFTSITII